jgi:translation initiation factor IF-3
VSTPQLRINRQIQSKEVRLLREDGTQIGVVAIGEALSQAEAAGIDAVEIAPLATPPVVKLIDYKKYLYQLAKKDQASKSAQKKVDLKEIRLTPFMAENDFSTKLNRGKQFLSEGHKLRVTVKFVGRQLSHKEFGDQILTKVYTQLDGLAAVDQAGKWFGKQLTSVLTPIKKTKNSNETKN